jgi:Holliday junction resolvase
MGYKSDGSTDKYQIECKQTAKDSLSVKSEWLEKISYEAYPNGRIPLVSLRFLNILDPLVSQDWIVIPATEFKRLTELTEFPT